MKYLLPLFLLLLPLPSWAEESLHLPDQQATRIGQLIWQNEGAGKVSNLTVWNEGEDFPSLGIGHFIWYPQGVEGPFTESFPLLISYLAQQHHPLPSWLSTQSHAPWTSKREFDLAFNEPRMTELRQFLLDTIALQTRFIIQRQQQALPQILQVLPDAEQVLVKQRYQRLLQHANGPYALIDYVNFKGEGISEKERYQGEGWGLLQVLQQMNDENNDVLAEFVRAANFVLTRRVANAPRDESRWLPGWRKRLATYRP